MTDEELLAKGGQGPDADDEELLNRKPGSDARGHAYDPRFAPTPEDDQEELAPSSKAVLSRAFTPQSYQDVQESLKPPQRQKPAVTEGGPAPTRAQAFVRGRLQGSTFGFGDELAAAIDAGVSHVPGVRSFAQMFQDSSLPPLTNSDVSYQERRDAYRAKNKAAEEAHKGFYTAGQMEGGLETAKFMPSIGTGIPGAIKTGGLAGALTGLGESEAELSGTKPLGPELKQAAYDTAKSGIAGGIVSGVLAKGLDVLSKHAVKNAHGWVANDVAGDVPSASTPTARKQMADDAVNVAKVVRSDKPLDDAINAARANNADDIKAAQGVVADRLKSTGDKLSPGWKQVDKSLPQPLTSGRVVDHLNEHAGALEATGNRTDKVEAAAVRQIADDVKTAKDWGAAKQTFNPKQPVSNGTFAGMETEKAIKALEKMKDVAEQTVDALEPWNAKEGARGLPAEERAVRRAAAVARVDALDSEIDRLTKEATSSAFDPDHVVSVEQLQKLWSDHAGIAYQSQGGINGTATFNRRLDVASHLRDLRDEIMGEAAQTNPAAVAHMQVNLARYSALKRIEQVLDQRANAAKRAGNPMVPQWLSHLGQHTRAIGAGGLTASAYAAAQGHYKTAALLAAPAVYTMGRRAVDRGMANLIEAAPESAQARVILQLIQQGIPKAAAIQAARSVAPGGMLSPVIDQTVEGATTAAKSIVGGGEQ